MERLRRTSVVSTEVLTMLRIKKYLQREAGGLLPVEKKITKRNAANAKKL